MKYSFLLFILLIFSCEKIETTASLEPQLEDKWLVFKSELDLKRFIEDGKSQKIQDFKDRLKEYTTDKFKSLLPLTNDNNDDQIRLYAKKKQNEKIMNQANYSAIKNKINELTIDADDDEIIADPYFASILNEDREVIVGQKVYRYTENGLLYTNVKNFKNLEYAAKSLHSKRMKITIGEFNIGNDVAVFIPNSSRLRSKNGFNRDDEYFGDEDGDDSGDVGSGGGSSGSSLTRDEIIDNLKICEYRSNVLNKIFGPSEKCIENFDKKHRIKVKTWAQDYKIFASTGVKVKSQKRKLGVWFANKINELELGYSLAVFKYKGSSLWPSVNSSLTQTFHFEHNGYTVDQYGRYVGSASPARKLFDNYPLPNDQNLIKIWIYKPIQDVIKSITGKNITHLDYTGKDFNRVIRQLVKDAVKQLKRSGKKLSNSTETMIIFEDPELNNITFVYTNWRSAKTNENKISHIFDWSTAVIGVKVKGDSSSPIYSAPKKPKDFKIVCYGMGRKGSTWKGGKIVID
jgi:hypothetical protein